MSCHGFIGHVDLAKMIFSVFIIFVFLEITPATAAGKHEDSVIQLSRREELVNWASYGEEKLSTIVISGKLLCHADKHSGHPYPVSGSHDFLKLPLLSFLSLKCIDNHELNIGLDVIQST